jgi:hypothetical protein
MVAMEKSGTAMTARLCGIFPRGEKAYLAAFVALLLTYAVPVVLQWCGFDGMTNLLLGEDGVYEYLGALFCLAASALFLAAYAWFPVRRKRNASRTGRNIFFLLLSLALFCLFGEEISWGQRLLGLRTPEFMVAVNAQRELTVHNLACFQRSTHNLLGDNLTRAANLYLALSIVMLAFPTFGRLVASAGLPVASVRVALMVVVNRLLHACVMGLFGNPLGTGDTYRMGEIFETNVEALFLVFALEIYLSLRRQRSAFPSCR